MQLARLEEIRDCIWRSHGWKDGCSDEELKWIRARWENMPGWYTFYDAVRHLIEETKRIEPEVKT